MTVYEIITERITQQLDRGVVPWRKPWDTGLPQNLFTRKHYRGVNVFVLQSLGFSSPYFLTARQVSELGGHIRPGSRGAPVVYWRWLKREEEKSERDEQEQRGRAPLLRYYTVFNLTQTEGVPAPAGDARPPFAPIEACERVTAQMPRPPQIEHGGTQAFYQPSRDFVRIPRRESFKTPAAYYATLFHELTHSTGHGSRLNRKGITDAVMFGSHEYSREELIAEMGSAFLAGHCGIETATVPDAAAYIASWLRVLKGDTRMVVLAAAQAQKAADFILSVKHGDEPPQEVA